MARGYKVFDRAKSILKRMVLGSLRGKFLVWNELDVEASSVSLESLLRLSRGGNHLNTTGILELMPFLQKAPGNTLKKKNKPDPETGREFEVKRQFRAAWQLTKQLYGIEMVIEFRKQLYRPMAPKKTREQDRAGRMRRKIWFVERETADQRCELEPGKLVAFQNLVAGFKPEFQVPMLVALLSMQTKLPPRSYGLLLRIRIANSWSTSPPSRSSMPSVSRSS